MYSSTSMPSQISNEGDVGYFIIYGDLDGNPINLVGKPVNSLLDEVLAPVDRDVFKRENRYYRALMPENGAAAGAGAGASSNAAPSGSASAAPPAKDER